jgi:hypothetical protein
MIVRPNADLMPSNSKSGDTVAGHAMDADTNFRRPTPMTASNVHGGGSNRGFGFAQDPTGENDYPRPDAALEGLPGFGGPGLGTPWKGAQ